ncbi:hypothetical protein CDD83_10425 [Cordyceps sp. RAO-2017]|nr:hypothetical protein CDD83_10425 [Cordyceps sp. RAO-2017]
MSPRSFSRWMALAPVIKIGTEAGGAPGKIEGRGRRRCVPLRDNIERRWCRPNDCAAGRRLWGLDTRVNAFSATSRFFFGRSPRQFRGCLSLPSSIGLWTTVRMPSSPQPTAIYISHVPSETRRPVSFFSSSACSSAASSSSRPALGPETIGSGATVDRVSWHEPKAPARPGPAAPLPFCSRLEPPSEQPPLLDSAGSTLVEDLTGPKDLQIGPLSLPLPDREASRGSIWTSFCIFTFFPTARFRTGGRPEIEDGIPAA